MSDSEPAVRLQAYGGLRMWRSGAEVDIGAPRLRTLVAALLAARLGKLSVPRETTVVIGPEQEATVVAPTSGTVLAVLKRRDTPVAAGEAVVQLDALALTQAVQDAHFALSSAQVSLGSASATSQSQAVQAELAVRAAETSYRAAEIDFLEAQDLYGIGAISQSELSAAETAFLSAETALGQARATLEQAASGGSVELLQLQVTQAEANLASAQAALAGANVIEVMHTRHGQGLQISEVILQLSVETRGEEHRVRVIEILREAGFIPTVVED